MTAPTAAPELAEVPIPGDLIIERLAARLAAEAARAETQTARADALAVELASSRRQLEEAAGLVAELTEQIDRAQHDRKGGGDEDQPSQ